MFYGVYIFPFAQAAREETRDVPLTHRVFRGTSRSPSSKRYPTFACNVRKGVWSEQAMEKALQAYTAGEMTLREASTQFGVPKSTLHDRVSGRVQPGAVPGAPKYLDDEEEEELDG